MGNNLKKLAKSNRSNESEASKSRNHTQWNGENSDGASIMRDASDEDQHLITSPIFKMNDYCFDEFFDYLSLADLHALSQTCKTMHQMTGSFFKRNYSGAKVVCLSDGIYVIFSDCFKTKCIPIRHFLQFITSIEIGKHIVNIKKPTYPRHHSYHNDLNIKLKYIKLHADELKSVKRLTLTNVCVNAKSVSYILDILPNIEMLKLRFSTVIGDLYEVLLKYCVNVQHLQLCRVKLDNKWLLRQYEKLERFDLVVNDDNIEYKIDELCTFFERNPNVRTFSCDKYTLWSNKDALLNSKLGLDTFELKQHPTLYVPYHVTYDLLRQLHTHGFYKRLNINGSDFCLNPEHHEYFAPLLEKFFIDDCEELIWISNNFIECNEIAICCSFYHNGHHEIFVNHGEKPNYYFGVDILRIVEYIQQMKNLKRIKFFNFTFEAILKLEMLNTEREKLAGARKVTIYVPDAVYLATKWATKNGTTNFSLIEMKRMDSYEWICYLSDWWMEDLRLQKKKNSQMLKF